MIGGPQRYWYERFGIEPPFPWPLTVLFVVLVLIGVSVVLWHH